MVRTPWVFGLTGFWAKCWMDEVDRMDGWMDRWILESPFKGLRSRPLWLMQHLWCWYICVKHFKVVPRSQNCVIYIIIIMTIIMNYFANSKTFHHRQGGHAWPPHVQHQLVLVRHLGGKKACLFLLNIFHDLGEKKWVIFIYLHRKAPSLEG